MLSAGAFTGRFNYLQLAKGLALSQSLFVCSLQGVCAERNTAAFFYKERKGGGEGGRGTLNRTSFSPACSGNPCPFSQAQDRGQALAIGFSIFSECSGSVGLSPRGCPGYTLFYVLVLSVFSKSLSETAGVSDTSLFSADQIKVGCDWAFSYFSSKSV